MRFLPLLVLFCTAYPALADHSLYCTDGHLMLSVPSPVTPSQNIGEFVDSAHSAGLACGESNKLDKIECDGFANGDLTLALRVQIDVPNLVGTVSSGSTVTSLTCTYNPPN